MATKVDSPSVEKSSVSASSPKVSMFGKKSGFVIPKNKLSGSLVPAFRGSAKPDAAAAAAATATGTAVKEESTKQVQRKTKWGPDLMQDPAVRKGRALAYQTRVEQIGRVLKSGAVEAEDLKDESAADNADQEVNRKFELLELEKREIIGEILRLNPSYKAPADYKPLLKEGKVPIPVKEYPGYNFIGLLLGPESNTQKRLEEETGAKIRVYGIKANAKDKCEITQSDVAEAQCAYEELYVNVSADSYEKVDAAVALIELLVTPVSVNAAVASKNSTSVAGDNANAYDQSQKNLASGYTMAPMADVNQSVTQPTLISAQSGQLQFQRPYAAPWFPVVAPNSSSRPSSGFMPLPMQSNPIRFPQSPSGPPNMPPYFGRPPFSPVPRTSTPPMTRPQLPMQQAIQQLSLNQTVPPQNNSMPGQQPPLVYHVMSSQPSSTTPMLIPSSRPSFMTMLPPGPPSSVNVQPGFMARPTMPGTPGWSVTQPLRPNASQMALSSNLSFRPQQAGPPMPNNLSRPPNANFAPNFPSQTSSGPPFTSVAPQIGPVAAPAVISASSGAPLLAPMLPSVRLAMPSSVPRPSPIVSVSPVAAGRPSVLQSAPVLGASTPHGVQAVPPPQAATAVMNQPHVRTPSLAPRPIQLPGQLPQVLPAVTGPASGTMSSFSHMKPPISTGISAPSVQAPLPVRPSLSDFTFQPQRSQVPASPTAAWPNSSSVIASPLHRAAPQAPSFRPALQSPTAPVGTQGFPQALSVNQASQAPAPLPPSPGASFPTNSTISRPPPRFPFPNSNLGAPMAPVPQMGPPKFFPAPQVPNFTGTMPAQPASLLQPQQSQLPPANRPSDFMIPKQQFSNINPLGYVAGRMPSAPVGNQTYDPFSPTSISPAPPQVANAKLRKPEADPEYEDLMASVGVK